jgi:hypothetical protein
MDERGEVGVSDVEARRAANRAAFPAVTAIVDEFRNAFGDDVKVLGGEEHSTGKRFGSDGDVWAGCNGCTGRTCDHPQPATVFCGHRERIEKAHVAGLWIEGGCMRLGGRR